MVTRKDYTVKFRDYGNITVPKGTRVTHKTALGFDRNYNFVAELDWVTKFYPTIDNILKMDLENYGLNIPEEYLNKIEKEHLNKNEHIYGNKGAVWSDEVHISISGQSTTLCGTPMLAFNWAMIENLSHVSCPKCIDKKKNNV